MNSDAEEKYSSYSFKDDSRWSQYVDQLYPTPTPDQLEARRRKWYKKNVDPTFEAEPANPSSSSENASYSNPTNNYTSSANADGAYQRTSSNRSSDQQESSRNSTAGSSSASFNASQSQSEANSDSPRRSSAAVPPLKNILYNIEGWLKIIFFVMALVMQSIANWLAVAICLLGWFRQCGRPKWDKEYAKKALQNEFIQNLFYMIPFTFFPGAKTLVYFLPLGIHFWIGACEFVAMRQPRLYQLGKKYIDLTRNQTNQYQLKLQKAKIEMYIFAYILLFCILGHQSFLLLIFYGNYLRIKYVINYFTQAAFGDLNSWLEAKVVSNPSVPGILKTIIRKLRDLGGYLTRM